MLYKKGILTAIVFFIWIGSSSAQAVNYVPVDKVTHHIAYSATVLTPEKSQIDLMNCARTWAFAVAGGDTLNDSIRANKTILLVNGSCPFIYTGLDKNRKVLLRYKARLCIYNGYFEYDVTDFLLCYAGIAPIQAELCFVNYTSTQNERTAQSIADQRKSFIETTAAILEHLKQTVSGKMNVDKVGRSNNLPK